MKLKEYLEQTQESLTEFAAKCGWNFSKMYRIYTGKACTLSSAYIIHKKTNGYVTFEDLLTGDQRKEVEETLNPTQQQN